MKKMQGTIEKPNVGDIERAVSLLGGSLLAYYALRRMMWPLLVGAAAGLLIERGITGRSRINARLDIASARNGLSSRLGIAGARNGADNGERRPVEIPLPRSFDVDKSVTINKSPAEVYAFWRQLSNLPRFMQHLESVTEAGERRSHWVAKAPISTEWDAEITDERPDEVIAWRSLEGSRVKTAGAVHFVPAPEGRGTEVQISLSYSPPGGPAGAAIAALFKPITQQQIKEDLRRLKAILEAGEAPTVSGQPSGRIEVSREYAETEHHYETHRRRRGDVVEEASEDSFPASDAPGWIKRTD